jgi:hypothetical protein
MESKVGRLRSVLARRVSGRGRRFSPDLRRQIWLVGRQLRDEGKSWNGIGAELGMRGERVRRLCEDAAPGFAAVEVVNEIVARGLVLVTPSGFRIEGLDAASAAMLIRRLS